jgi:hypothetical protein
MKLYKPAKVFIEQAVRNSPIALSVREHLGDDRIEIISSAKSVMQDMTLRRSQHADAKKLLVLLFLCIFV